MCVAAFPVQAGPSAGAPAGCAHSDTAGHHQRSLAVHQDTQAAGLTWARVHQLWPLPRTSKSPFNASTLFTIKYWVLKL